MEEYSKEKAGRKGGRESSMSREQAAANSIKHGLFAEPSLLFGLASDDEKEWTLANFESMVEEAPFAEDAIHRRQMLWEVAIDMLKIRRGNDYLAETGMVEERILRHPDGYPVINANDEKEVLTRENRINFVLNRLRRSNLRKLKELNMLNPEAESTQSLAIYLTNLRRESEGKEPMSESFSSSASDDDPSVALSNLRKSMDSER